MQGSPRFHTSCCALVLASMVGACAFVDEQISLAPTSHVPSTDVGGGAVVAVKVADERPSAMIGHRGPMRADIRPTTDIAQVVDGAVRQGLRDQGFAPVEYSKTAPCSLLVEVRDLSYDTSAGFFTGGIQTRATLKARASRPDDTFEQVYRSEKEERVLVVPTEASDAAQINHVLSGVIDQMMADQRLLSFLAAQAAAPDGMQPAAISPGVTAATGPAR